MDTMYRKKSREAEEAISSEKKQKKEKHVADGYRSKIRPREKHPDSVDTQRRISRNLDALNRNLVEHPSTAEKEKTLVVTEEDRGAKVVTRAARVSAPIPLAFIFSLVVFAVVFMYMVSLYVQVEEYSHSIEVMESRVAELKEESTRLEVQLESKYDLDEIERIATQEYGMVVASSLSKKYVSVSDDKDVWQECEAEEEKPGIFRQIFSGIKTILGKGEE